MCNFWVGRSCGNEACIPFFLPKRSISTSRAFRLQTQDHRGARVYNSSFRLFYDKSL